LGEDREVRGKAVRLVLEGQILGGIIYIKWPAVGGLAKQVRS